MVLVHFTRPENRSDNNGIHSNLEMEKATRKQDFCDVSRLHLSSAARGLRREVFAAARCDTENPPSVRKQNPPRNRPSGNLLE